MNHQLYTSTKWIHISARETMGIATCDPSTWFYLLWWPINHTAPHLQNSISQTSKEQNVFFLLNFSLKSRDQETSPTKVKTDSTFFQDPNNFNRKNGFLPFTTFYFCVQSTRTVLNWKAPVKISRSGLTWKGRLLEKNVNPGSLLRWHQSAANRCKLFITYFPNLTGLGKCWVTFQSLYLSGTLSDARLVFSYSFLLRPRFCRCKTS